MKTSYDGRDIPIPHSSLAEKFWTYSLDVYGRPGVRSALLDLQDEAGLDINCVLFCCWTGTAGYSALDRAEIEAILGISRDWNTRIVAGLRAVRKALKERGAGHDDASDLRTAVKDLELEAERIQQTLLAGVLTRPPDVASSIAISRANVDAYLEACACRLTPRLRGSLEHVATACAYR